MQTLCEVPSDLSSEVEYKRSDLHQFSNAFTLTVAQHQLWYSQVTDKKEEPFKVKSLTSFFYSRNLLKIPRPVILILIILEQHIL